MELNGLIVSVTNQSMILELASQTKANTQLLHVYTLLYRYNRVLVPLCYEASSQISTLKSISLVILEQYPTVNVSMKILLMGSHFCLIYFLCTPLHGLVFYRLNYPISLFPSYLNHAYIYFNETCAIISLMYPLKVTEFTN